MRISNATRKTIIARDARLCQAIHCKARGLMFTRRREEFALIFAFSKPERPMMHNLFVFYALDLLILDAKMKVLEIKEGFKPFTPYYKPMNEARYIIETVHGIVKKTKTRVGDRLSLDN